MQLAIKATCAETIQCSLLHELSPFRCDPNPGKTCSTPSRSCANSTHVTNGFDLAVATSVFPYWVNNGSRRKRREYYDDFNRWPTKKTAPALRSQARWRYQNGKVPGRKRTAMYMELVVKATNTERPKFRLPHEGHLFAVTKVFTRSVALLPTVGQNADHFCYSIKRFFAHCVKPFHDM